MKYEPANNRLPRELHLTIHLDIHSRFVKKNNCGFIMREQK